mgnify:CR=1 FL=1
MNVDLAKILDSFKEYYGFPVPLGVCLIVVIVLVITFCILQTNRRKDYKNTQEFSKETIAELREILSKREERVKYLEDRMNFCQENHRGGN